MSYVWGIGKFMFKHRAAWGSGGINPPKAMQALPSESNYSINIGNPDPRPSVSLALKSKRFYFGDNFSWATYFDQLFLDGIQNDRSIGDIYTHRKNIGMLILRNN